jgi:hypothetical protein
MISALKEAPIVIMDLCNSDRQWTSSTPVTGSNNRQVIKYAKQQQEPSIEATKTTNKTTMDKQQEPAKDATKSTNKITIDQQQKREES